MSGPDPKKTRIQSYHDPELLSRLEQIQRDRNISSTSAIVELAVREWTDSVRPKIPRKDRVAYLLRNQKGPRAASGCSGGGLDYEHSDDWELGGGRWILDWFLRREPDWQQHHLCMIPRHWPLPLLTREHRCNDNGGSSFGVMNWINEHIDNEACEPHCRFPTDFETLLESEWLAVIDRYRGCCGEKIRPPSGPHWDAICDYPDHHPDPQ